MTSRRVGVWSWHGVAGGLILAGLLAACTSPGSSAHRATPKPTPSNQVVGGPAGTYLVPDGIHKIKHVIIVMQENRSFDSYFGTFPGADGIPMRHGVPTVCMPNPKKRLYPPLP